MIEQAMSVDTDVIEIVVLTVVMAILLGLGGSK